MNEEQSKRLADAAEAVLHASDALDEATESMQNPKLDDAQDRQRAQAAQQMASKLEQAGRRIEEALRKGTVASATLGRDGAFTRYREAADALRSGREAAKQVPDQDGTPAKREKANEAFGKLEAAMQGAIAIVFGDA